LKEDANLKISETVFTGDTLFKGSVGRSDLWGGDSELLIKSIKGRLLNLDGDTIAWPGHGFKTRIGEEKISNPFLTAP
jgi:glyoxylase-like metal-dependent hydrolase (beta-lactamase superfamily II)